MKRILAFVIPAIAAAPTSTAQSVPEKSAQAAKKRVERADQLPVHSYRVPGSASKLLTDDEAFAVLMVTVRQDLEGDLRDYEITDKTTLKSYYDTLSTIGLLERRYDDVLGYLNRIRDLEDKPAAKLVSGMIQRAIVAALGLQFM